MQYGQPCLLRLQHGAYQNILHSIEPEMLFFGTVAEQRNDFGNAQFGRFFEEPFKAAVVFEQ